MRLTFDPASAERALQLKPDLFLDMVRGQCLADGSFYHRDAVVVPEPELAVVKRSPLMDNPAHACRASLKKSQQERKHHANEPHRDSNVRAKLVVAHPEFLLRTSATS